MHATDDEKLVQWYQQGNRNACEFLFQRYYEYVYKVFRWKGVPAPDAEDFTQDIFLKLTDGLLHFAGKSCFKTYLDRALAHKLVDFYRKHHTKTGLLREKFFDLCDIDFSRHSVYEEVAARNLDQPWRTQEIEQALQHCMEKLANLTYRAVVALWLDGFRLQQIAQILTLPLGTVNSHSARGREKLRRCLEAQEVI